MKTKNVLYLIALGTGLMSLGCVLVAIMASFTVPAEPEPTSEIVAQVELATSEPVQLPTEAPAAVVPSETPVLVPSETRTPIPTEDAALTAYALAVGEIGDVWIDGLETIADLMFEAVNDMTLMGDEDWKNEVTGVLIEIVIASWDLRELDPPRDMQMTHDYLITAAWEMDLMAGYLEEGIEELNGVKIGQATEAIVLATEYIELAGYFLP